SPLTGLSFGAREREHPVRRRIEVMVRTMVMLESFVFIFRCWCDLRPNENYTKKVSSNMCKTRGRPRVEHERDKTNAQRSTLNFQRRIRMSGCRPLRAGWRS